MATELAREMMVVEEIAVQAGTLALSLLRDNRLDARAKGLRDVVTEADFASERLIVDALARAFPDDGIVGEEGAGSDSASGRRWYVDPVDGTFNFSRKLPLWCVSIALFEGSEPILGVIYDANRQEVFTAVRGRGAKLNGSAITTSTVTRLEDAIVHITVDFEDRSVDDGMQDLLRLQPRILRSRNLGSAALALAYVACGRLDAMVHRSANAWDYGAGIVLIREAGGTASALDGGPYRETSRSVLVAATEELQAGMLDALRPA